MNESGFSPSIPVIWSEELYRDISTRAWGGMGTVGRKRRDCEDCDSHRRKEPVMSHQQAKKEILSPTTAVLSERGIYHSCKNQVFQRPWSISSFSDGYKRQPSVRPFVHIVLQQSFPQSSRMLSSLPLTKVTFFLITVTFTNDG